MIAGQTSPPLVEDFCRDFDWSRLASTRYVLAHKFFNQGHFQARIVIYAAVLVACRYVIAWDIARTHPESPCECHPLCDLANDSASPFIRGMQYLHALSAAGVHDRLYAIACLCGFQDGACFMESHHELNKLLRCASLALSRWLWKRNIKYRTPPLVLAQMADNRLSFNQKYAMLDRVHKKNMCCLDDYCTKKTRKCFTDTADWIAPENLDVMESITVSTPVHNGKVDRLHSRNQRHNPTSSTWTTFCADFIKSEAKSLAADVDKSMIRSQALSDNQNGNIGHIANDSTGNEDAAAQPESTALISGHSQLGVFYMQCLREDKLAGKQVRIGSTDYWKDVWERFERVGQAKKRALQNIAQFNSGKPRRSRAKLGITATYCASKPAIACHTAACGSNCDSVSASSESSLVPAVKLKPTALASLMGIPASLSQLALEDDVACASCAKLGKLHLMPPQHASLLLRRTALEHGTVPGFDSISKHPMSIDPFAAEYQSWPGGYNGISQTFNSKLAQVGRDLGGVPDKIPSLRHCGNLCAAQRATTRARRLGIDSLKKASSGLPCSPMLLVHAACHCFSLIAPTDRLCAAQWLLSGLATRITLPLVPVEVPFAPKLLFNRIVIDSLRHCHIENAPHNCCCHFFRLLAIEYDLDPLLDADSGEVLLQGIL